MTKQEIFDRAVAGLASQGFKRANDGRICQYRSPDGCRKCAVGWLIPDDKYKPEWEGQAVNTDVLISNSEWHDADARRKLTELLTAADVPLEHDVVFFVEDLQTAHDEAYGWDNGEEVDKPAKMRASLLKLGQDNGLTIPEVLNG